MAKYIPIDHCEHKHGKKLPARGASFCCAWNILDWAVLARDVLCDRVRCRQRLCYCVGVIRVPGDHARDALLVS